MFGDEADAAHQGIDRKPGGPGALGEQQQNTACLQVRHGLLDHLPRRVIAYIARQTGSRTQEHVFHQLRLHHAHQIRVPGENQQCIDQRRVVRRQNHRRAAFQGVDGFQVQTVGSRDGQGPGINAKARHDAAPPDGRADARRQNEIERQRENRPGQADQAQQRQRTVEREIFVSDLQ